MDMGGFDHGRAGDDRSCHDQSEEQGSVRDTVLDLAGDERRMHVRAYNHWVSLLKGRPFPSITDLDPATIVDFGAHSVLLDFTRDLENPAIAYLGRALREECGIDAMVAHISDVPNRSLLSRLTDHYLQIIANRAPVGFEAEFVASRGCRTMYRGILTPYSSSGEQIDFIYGVINWKEVVDVETQGALQAELNASLGHVSPQKSAASVWADGPSADKGSLVTPCETLQDHLSVARDIAAAVLSAEGRSRRALYEALGRAHDFALAADADCEAFANLLDQNGIKLQLRAPMTPIVKLIFGLQFEKTRLTEYACVLNYARRISIAQGNLVAFLEKFEGGIKAIVAVERQLKRGPAHVPKSVSLGERATMARLSIAVNGSEGDVVVLVARIAADGDLDVVGAIGGDHALSRKAVLALR